MAIRERSLSDYGLCAAPLFEGVELEDLLRLTAQLHPHHLESGEQLMREGEQGRFFAIVAEGELEITRETPTGVEELGHAGPGSVLGELALLGSGARQATVTATEPSMALVGDVNAFATLLDLEAVHERIQRVVSTRLAENARSVGVRLRDGSTVRVRPMLRDDREGFVDALRELSQESLRRRFFTGGQPSPRVIDYLVELDYVHHFAWVVVDDVTREGVAEARFIRSEDSPGRAEVAFTVKDEHQGRGLGTLLLGAVAAAASVAGITRLTASLLNENIPMRSVLAKGGARFKRGEPGVTDADLDVDAAAAVVDADVRLELQAAARGIVTAAGLALTSRR